MAEEQHEYDGRLGKLEGHAIKTEGRLDRIEDTLIEHGRKQDAAASQLSTILAAVTGIQSAPRFDIHEWARTLGVVVVVCGSLAGLSVWLIVTLTRTDTATQELKLQHLRELTELRLRYALPNISTHERKEDKEPPK